MTTYNRWIGPDCHILVDGCMRLLAEPEAAIWPQLANFQLSEDEPFAPCWLAMAGAIWPHMSSAPIDVEIFKSALGRLEAVAPQCPPAYRFALRHWPERVTQEALATPAGEFYVDYLSYNMSDINYKNLDVILNYLHFIPYMDLDKYFRLVISSIKNISSKIPENFLFFLISRYNLFKEKEKNLILEIIKRENNNMSIKVIEVLIDSWYGISMREFFDIIEQNTLKAFICGYLDYDINDKMKDILGGGNLDEEGAEICIFYITGLIFNNLQYSRLEKVNYIINILDKNELEDYLKLINFIMFLREEDIISINNKKIYKILSKILLLASISGENNQLRKIEEFFQYNTKKKYISDYIEEFLKDESIKFLNPDNTFLILNKLDHRCVLALLKNIAKNKLLISEDAINKYIEFLVKNNFNFNFWEILNHHYVSDEIYPRTFKRYRMSYIYKLKRDSQYNVMTGRYKAERREGLGAVLDMIKVMRDIMLVESAETYQHITRWLMRQDIKIALPIFMLIYNNKYSKFNLEFYNESNKKHMLNLMNINKEKGGEIKNILGISF